MGQGLDGIDFPSGRLIIYACCFLCNRLHAACRNDWFVHPDFKPAKSPIADKNRADFKKLQEDNWASWLAQQGKGKFPEEADRAR